MADAPVLIRGARVVDPVSGLDGTRDLMLAEGKVREVGVGLDAAGAAIVEADGLVAAPGFFDMHVHFREPGQEYKETVATGAAAAAAGGFTDVMCMANTDPPNDTPSVTAHIRRLGEATGFARVHPAAATTVGMRGERITEFARLRRAGAVALSDDGLPVGDPGILRRALEYARPLGLPVVEHCETLEVTAGGVMNEGAMATALGLRGIPAASEYIAVERNIALAELAGGRLHVAHVSTARSVEAIRRAKQRGVAVTAEATPHHLLLTDAACDRHDTAAKMKPPLASKTDREALLAAVADGVIDAIATDHAPHHADEKDLCFESAPFGIVGLETAVPLVLDRLVGGGALELSDAVRLLAVGPRRALGLPGGTLAPGSPADLTLLDLEATFTVRPEEFRSLGRSTPFAGLTLRGRVESTWVGGRRAFSRSG